MNADAFFTQRVYDLRQRLLNEKDARKRDTLMLEIAQEALKTHDPTDTVFVDEYHAYFDELEIAATNYKQAARRVARLVCDGIDAKGQEDGDQPARRRLN